MWGWLRYLLYTSPKEAYAPAPVIPLPKIKSMIDADKLSKIAPTIKGNRAETIAASLDKICPLYGIDKPTIFHEFISNVLHECNEFNVLEENLNYQAVALTKVFGRHRISLDDCYRYGRTAKQPANKVEIANRIYGGDWGKVNLGNMKPMDGWIYRGSGCIQLTGRANVTQFTNYYNRKFSQTITPEDMAEKLRSDIDIGIHAACWFFAISKNLIQAAIDDNMLHIILKINGGYIGKDDRMKYYELAKKYIV